MDIGAVLWVIWPYLVVLYVLDCLLIVRTGHLLITKNPVMGSSVWGAGLRLTGLLPGDYSFLSLEEPVLLTEKGIHIKMVPSGGDLRPPRPEDLHFISYENIKSLSRKGRKVFVNQVLACAETTAVAAGALEKKLEDILCTTPGQKKNRITELLTASVDLNAAREVVDRIRNRASLMIKTSGLLMFLLFFVFPLTLFARPPAYLLWVETLLVAIVCICVGALWIRLHKALLPGESSDLVEELVVFTLFPVSLLHAFGKLTRRLLGSYEATALIAALAPEKAGEVLQREHARMRAAAVLNHPEDLKALFNARVKALETLAGLAGFDLFAASAHESHDKGERTCPICSAAYRDGIYKCADCGVPLVK